MAIFTSQTPMLKKEEVKRPWYVVDAKGKTLGRLASIIAYRLQGKHRPDYTPHVDAGDFIVVINADKIKLTGKKLDQKIYWRHSGYMGGIKLTPAKKMLNKKPEEVIRLAVKRMLPKNRLGRKMLKKLKVYRGETHPHTAQKPKALEI
ncbi:ribosomal protein L13 [Thermodesulfatator indicus DSM 15286]|uniref:Large ribosomal subunit protein uL13 n=1 Tax=Thermodesulfatator indicus (strain DSM 15286 / JCM 11887 / CIR29812) TaxID=667014 RepID=F8A9L3_THEID|nr:50S ribosomal protein L13 [Thermodesulfatator indicus]AEH45239.1 ribosomal protein L13 [Thermodesulfatator indicus DSM 15286]